MKAIVLSCLLLAQALPLMAAENSVLARRAAKAAETLSHGSIVTVEQTGDAAPDIAMAGHREPAGVPPEKVIFEIGSVSKVFTGLLLAQAVVEKKVTLDTTLRELMGSRQAFADANVAGITLRQLATHTSGLPRLPDNAVEKVDVSDPYASYDRTDLDAYLAKARLAHAPPFESEYSNLGGGLLGDLLARVYGKTWEDLVVERIAKPLGMQDTCVTLNAEQKRRVAPPYAGAEKVKHWTFQALAGAGALRSTAADMLILGRAMIQPGKTPLKEAIELMVQQQGSSGTGLCIQLLKIKDRNSYWHNGGTGGYSSWLSVNTAAARVVVILINNGALTAEEVMTGTAGNKPAMPPSGPADPALADYVGEYDTGVKAGSTSIYYTFEGHGPELWMQITGQPKIPLERHPATADRFVFKPVKAEIEFTREKGKVVSTTLFQAGREIKAGKLAASSTTK